MPRFDRIRSAEELNCEGLSVPSEVERLRADLAKMEALMIRWRIAAQRWTPGGSEYMDPAFCERFIQERREDAHRTKVENVRLRRAVALCREGLGIAAGWASRKPDSQNARDKIRAALDAIREAVRQERAA